MRVIACQQNICEEKWFLQIVRLDNLKSVHNFFFCLIGKLSDVSGPQYKFVSSNITIPNQ